MIVFDSTCALLTIFPDAPAPKDPTTNLPITEAARRVEYVLALAAERKERVGIPTPVLSEILVRAGTNITALVERFQKSSIFEIISFDHRAAIEVALIARDIITGGDKKDGSDEPWAKIKYDRQIVAIAKVVGASAIYSDDRGLKRVAERLGLQVIGLSECPLPPTEPQSALSLEGGKTHDAGQTTSTPDPS